MLHVLKYEFVKRWVTGEKAEKDEDDIQVELLEAICNMMELSGQRKFLLHKSLPNDKGLW
jgi:hypothetical protein